MGELSRRLMVTGGNVTGLTDQLVAEGLVERAADRGRPPRVRGAADAARASAHSTRWRRSTSAGSIEHAGGPDARPSASGCTRCSAGSRRRCSARRRRRIARRSDAHDAWTRQRRALRAITRATHFRWQADADGKVATITLNRPEKKNPLTFDSYAELRDLFRGLVYASDVKAVVITGAGGNFCSGGDVHEIIGPLTRMTMPELLRSRA